jgi:putative ABC transport system permease protein
MSRAGVISVIGTVLGTAAGFVPPIGLVFALRAADGRIGRWPLVIPWPSLAVTALVVPTLAVLIAGLFSRSRLTVERRPAT